MTFYVKLGRVAEEALRRHAERLERPLDSIIFEAIEELVDEYEEADRIKSDRTARA